MKTAILVESTHHGNTRKVVDAIAAAYDEVTVIDIKEHNKVNLGAYQCIGLASGIAYSKMYDGILKQAEKIPAGKKVLLIYTSGTLKDYVKGLRKELTDRGIHVLGSYHCKGFDSFGPFGMIGGINKKNPDSRDLAAAVDFYRQMREL